MLHVGYKNYIIKDKVLAITGFDSNPLRRIKTNLENENKLINCAYGNKVRSLVFLTDGFVVASANNSEKLKERLEGAKNARD